MGPAPGRTGQKESSVSEDETIFRTVMAGAERKNLRSKPVGEAMAALGRAFLGTPYVAHTLEEEGEERLVVNLRGLDCTTFMENTLVLARCLRLNTTTFEEYRKQLTFVRYRGGTIDGYPSRLHYFTDWVYDNERKGVVRDVTAALGGERSDRRVDFMSTHPGNYHQLANAEYLRAIGEVEEAMNERGFFVVPSRRVVDILPKLVDGDILGTATTAAGMDVSHTGIVVRERGVPRFLHAPLSGGAVWTVEDVDFVSGCGVLMSRALLEKVGLFATDYFMYYEDLDLCFRAREAGFRILCVTGARMWHAVSTSTGGTDSPLKQYYQVKSSLIFYRRHFSGVKLLLKVGLRYAHAGYTLIGALLRGRLKWAAVKLFLQGSREGFQPLSMASRTATPSTGQNIEFLATERRD